MNLWGQIPWKSICLWFLFLLLNLPLASFLCHSREEMTQNHHLSKYDLGRIAIFRYSSYFLMLMVILVSRLYEIKPCLRHIYQNQNPLALPLIACKIGRASCRER